MTNVIIIDINGVITNSGYDVISRHDAYGDALKRLNPDSQLYIVSRKKSSNQILTKNMEIIYAKSLLGFLKKSRKLLRSLEGSTLLVSGDPWESFLACTIIRKISKKQVPIQVQLHADVGSKNWRELNWGNRTRSISTPFSLKRAEQIRCVTGTQLANLEMILPTARSKTIVIPVPIKIESDRNNKRKSKHSYSISIVGRIHRDRGLEEFVRVCKVLADSFPNLRIIIVGEGPDEGWLRSALRDRDLLERSNFTGFINQQELSLMWQTFGCVASFAPSEAYGRTAREALIYGVPVLAKRSSGIEELAQNYDQKGIWIIDGLNDDAIRNLFNLVSGFIVGKDVSESIIRTVNSLNEELAKSWIIGSKLPMLKSSR